MNKSILISGILLLGVSCSKEMDYDATGIFEATTVTVSAETSGKILNFNKVEGDSINMGELIADVDSTLLVLQREQLNSQRLSAESNSPDISAQLAALRTQISHQENECARIGRLFADGAATQKQQDDAQSHLATLKAQKDALLSTLTKSKSSIYDNSSAILYQKEQIGEQIAKCRISSPLTGTILSKYAEAGEFTAPGKPLCKIADLNKIYLRAYFTASQLASIKLGQKVTVIADFGGDEQYEYPGTITWIAEESEFTPKSIQTKDSRANLVYAVKIAVKNDGRLKLGQYGEVRL
ncbi:MAG: HlyD family efflux transporter periplasmic adaptor subunit [Muribaculaceae bacterium]|nr:HlyD family efflux transporter periplasmic adaptor subunit [Muribaculaceae bacterium]